LVGIELGPLEPLVYQEPAFHFVVIALSTGITAFAFFYPTYFSRRQNMGRGLNEIIRILEADDSWRARRVLILKYEKKLETNEMELKKSAEKVRTNLIMTQSWIEEKGVPRMVLQELYSGVFKKMIEAYVKYMEEFHPTAQIERPIRKLYKSSSKWLKLESTDVVTKRFGKTGVNIYDKLGL
jgi:ribonucleotide reductase beta subunit family protein with ferritin-like domain